MIDRHTDAIDDNVIVIEWSVVSVSSTLACHACGTSVSRQNDAVRLMDAAAAAAADCADDVRLRQYWRLTSYQLRDQDHERASVRKVGLTTGAQLDGRPLKLSWLTNTRRNRHRTRTVAIDQTKPAWRHMRYEAIDRCRVPATGRHVYIDTVWLLYPPIVIPPKILTAVIRSRRNTLCVMFSLHFSQPKLFSVNYTAFPVGDRTPCLRLFYFCTSL